MAGYLGHKPTISNYTVDEFTTSSAQASSGNFTLSQTVTKSKTLEISVGGIDQPQSAYSVTGTTLAFGASVVTLGDIVIARHAGESISYPSLETGAVTVTKIGADAVDGTKIADNAINSEHYTTGSIDTAHIANDQITLAKMAGGTDGQIITYDASGDPVAVGPGTSGQILTSAGAGAPPTFAAAAPGGDVRNFIIDGDFTQWPEGTSQASLASAAYGPALWQVLETGSTVVTIARSTDVPTVAQSSHNSEFSMHIDITTVDSMADASDFFMIRHMVTGTDYAYLHAKQVTLAFWVKSDVTGTYCVSYQNSASNRSYIQEYTISSADTWEYKTLTSTLDTDTGTWLFTEADKGLIIMFMLGSGSDAESTKDSWLGTNDYATSSQVAFTATDTNDIRFAQVGLYIGSTAPTFLSPSIATVKDQVEYYVETRGLTDAASTYPKICMAHAIGTTTADCTIFYRTKRVVPTFALQGTITDYDYNSVTTAAVSSVSSYFGQTKSGATVRVNIASTTANGGGNLTGDTTAEHALIDARH